MGTVYAKDQGTPKNMDQHFTSKMMHKKQNELQDSNYNKEQDFEKNQNARVDKIHIDGLGRTKDDIIKSQVTELFKAHDFQEVIMGAHKVRGKLEALGCFKNIGIFIDISEGPNATPEGVEVTFTVREMKRLMGSVNTMVGNNEGSVIIGAKAPNIFGRGEKVQVEYAYSNKKSTNINISAIKPLMDDWLHTILTGSLYSTSSYFPWSGYTEKDNGFLLDIACNSGAINTIKHNFQYEASFRQVSCSRQASFSVREQCGPSLKSGLKHICSLDKRDAKLFPTRGSLIQFSSEVAGLGGDIGFIKNELLMQSNWSPHKYLTFQLAAQAGLLRSINNDMKISIIDQFFLGGPLNVRGFDIRGCGPRNEGNAVGGDVYWAAALHVYTPLPFRPGRNGFGDLFKLHGFVNGGNLSNLTTKFANNYKENMKIFTDNVRCSVGGGIAMELGSVARVELNVTMPLLYVRSDVLRQFQFGIGVQYL
ncbi:sorting and assembly machinery component 50 homolog B isoform X2 [Vespa crabro]|uniref:sorting and assembly machinery component 50 homolog B isoform X2 n=1 Tax=Vespa crabro TaxID=7445 RepID=UPI001F0227ED|nr:sorting and assembly machinery component 50 homolog B isoform X2 [Vespa crabro]